LAALGSLGGLLAACTPAPAAAPTSAPAAAAPTSASAGATAAPAAKPTAAAATSAPAVVATTGSLIKMSVGIPPSLTHLPYMLGQAKGLYAAEGIDVD